MSQASELVEQLDGRESLAVVCHSNPDPDCIASALALSHIAQAAAVERIDLLYGGAISHQQNRAFVNLLDLELASISTVDIDAYDAVAFVDHSIPGGNVDLPRETVVDIVIDHHPTSEPVTARFVDHRDDYGATATIMVEYLRDLDLEVDSRLASALLFAIHRERLDYIRGPTTTDYEAALFLSPLADADLLHQFYGSAFSPATLNAIGEAIRNRTQRGSTLVSGVGRTSERDALPQAADYLLNLEGVNTVLVYGVVRDAISMSARSIDPRVNLGVVLADAFDDIGEAGGHQDMAGARIPLGLFADRDDDDEALIAFASRRVRSRFFDAMNLEGSE